MRIIVSAIILLCLISSCSDDAAAPATEQATTPATAQAPTNKAPIPADIEKKLDKILNDFEKKISNNFWTKFTARTRHGGEGPTETTFDQDAYGAFMKKKGFTQIPNTWMDYKGSVDDVQVTILNNSVNGEHGGWIQQWTIDVESANDDGAFKKERKFEASRN